MNIGIDLDNTLVNTHKKMLDYIYSDEKKEELLNNIDSLTSGNTKNEMVKYFYKKYAIKIFENAELMDGAKDALNYLVQNNYKIVFITLRGDKGSMFSGSETTTIEYLKKHNIPYSKVIFNSKNKAIVCKEEKIDIMLDDSLRVISNINKTKTEAILFNSNNKPNYGCKQVTSWQEFIELLKEIR